MLITLILAMTSIATAQTQRVLVSFDENSRAAVVNLSATLKRRGVSVLKASERHGVAVLQGPAGSIKSIAEGLHGALIVEDEKPRYLQACENNCMVNDAPSGPASNETVPWGVKFVQANSTDAGPESLFNSTVWVCVTDTGKSSRKKSRILICQDL